MFREKYNISNNFDVIIKKNIPIGAGLGGGSADAAAVARLIIKIYNLKIKKELIEQLGSLEPIFQHVSFHIIKKLKGLVKSYIN